MTVQGFQKLPVVSNGNAAFRMSKCFPFSAAAGSALSERPSVPASVCRFVRPCVHLSGRLSVRLSARRSFRASVVRLSVRASVRASVCPRVRLSVRPSIRASLCPSVRASDCRGVHASVCVSRRAPVRAPVSPCVRMSMRPSVRESVCPFIRLSVRACPCVCPSVRFKHRCGNRSESTTTTTTIRPSAKRPVLPLVRPRERPLAAKRLVTVSAASVL